MKNSPYFEHVLKILKQMNKRFIILIMLFLFSYLLKGQTIEELENDLSWSSGDDMYGAKIGKAKLLQKMDPFNIAAIDYIVRYYNDRKVKDSITIFMDNLINEHKNETEPYIIKADFLSFELEFNDTSCLEKQIEILSKAYYINKEDLNINYELGKLYYKDFLIPYYQNHYFDNIQLDSLFINDLDSTIEKIITKKTSSFKHSADSALRLFQYLYTQHTDYKNLLYFPIQQLEHYLYNSSVEKIDSFMGITSDCYFPVWYFANLKKNWESDLSYDYIFELESSISDARWLTLQLKALKEPNLLLATKPSDKEIYRFTWLRSFHNLISIRIEKENNQIKLIWKKGSGEGGYEPEEIELNESKIISKSDWNDFKKLFDRLNFNELDNKEYRMIFDGAEWILERKNRGF